MHAGFLPMERGTNTVVLGLRNRSAALAGAQKYHSSPWYRGNLVPRTSDESQSSLLFALLVKEKKAGTT